MRKRRRRFPLSSQRRTEGTTASHSGRVCVWIVNHYADAPDRPAGTRHFDLAQRLVARGHEVVVFAAGFSNITHREERLPKWRLYRTQSFHGVRFVWLRTLPYSGNTWRRPLNMLTYVATFLVVQTSFPAPGTVIGSTVHPFAALAAWCVAKGRSARFLFEIRDLWPQTLVDLGVMREGSLTERFLRMVEAFLVRRASVIITLMPGVRDYLRDRGLPTSNVIYIPNGVDFASSQTHDLEVESLPVSVRNVLSVIGRQRIEGRFVVGYVGAFGRVNRLDVLIDAARLADARAPGRIGLILVGDGPERANLERRSQLCRSTAVVGAVPKEYVPAILRYLDAAVVHATATPVYRYGVSFNKLFDYMAAERPVVFACDSAYDPVAAVGAGISVHPGDPGAIADGFLALYALNPDERKRMGLVGRAYVIREHSMDQLGCRLASVIESGPDAPVVCAD